MPGLDTGDMLSKAETEIGPEEDAVELGQRLSTLGADLLVETLDGLAAGTITPQKQDSAEATYAPILKKEDGAIDWSQPAVAIHNRARGLQPWPGAYTKFRGQSLHVWRSRVASASRAQGTARTIRKLATAGGRVRHGMPGTGRSPDGRAEANFRGGFRKWPASGRE